jgi:hypothetical protein
LPFPAWRRIARTSTRLSMTSRTRRKVNMPRGASEDV